MDAFFTEAVEDAAEQIGRGIEALSVKWTG